MNLEALTINSDRLALQPRSGKGIIGKVGPGTQTVWLVGFGPSAPLSRSAK